MGTGHCPQSPGQVLQSPTQISFQRGGGGAGKGEGLVSPLLILSPGAGGTGPGPSPPASQWILPGAQLLPLQAAPGEGHVPCPAVVRSEPGSAWHHPGPRLCTRHQQRGPPLATRRRGLQPDSPEPTAPPRGARARASGQAAGNPRSVPSQPNRHPQLRATTPETRTREGTERTPTNTNARPRGPRLPEGGSAGAGDGEAPGAGRAPGVAGTCAIRAARPRQARAPAASQGFPVESG